MKRRITLSIALALSVVILSLMSSDRAAQAQQNQIKIVADTGMVTLGPNQVLRMSVMKDGSNNVTLENYVFRRIDYTQGVCGGGVCKHSISSQSQTAPVALASGEAASIDIAPMPGASGVRIMASSDARSPRITLLILDTVTGNVVSIYIPSSGTFF